MRGRYKFIISYLLQHKTMSLVILLSTFAGTFFHGIGIGLFVPLLETIRIEQSQAQVAWFMDKVNSLYAIFHITPSFSVLLFSILLMVILKAGLTLLQNILTQKLTVRLSKDLRYQCIENLVNVSVLYYYKKKIGDFINFIGREMRDGAAAFAVFLNLIAQISTLIMYIILRS